MSKIETLTRSIDRRLRRVERQLGANDAWLTRLMGPAGAGQDSALRILVRRFRNRSARG